jgi:hypothetical protein
MAATPTSPGATRATRLLTTRAIRLPTRVPSPNCSSLPPPPSKPADLLVSPWRQLGEIDFKDTFVSAEHVAASFPGRAVTFRREEDGAPLDPATAAAADVAPPYRVRFERAPGAAGSDAASSASSERVVVIPYRPPAPGPFPEDRPRQNAVRFTPVQVEAIRSGINPGLTLVVVRGGAGSRAGSGRRAAALVAPSCSCAPRGLPRFAPAPFPHPLTTRRARPARARRTRRCRPSQRCTTTSRGSASCW